MVEIPQVMYQILEEFMLDCIQFKCQNKMVLLGGIQINIAD